VQANFSVIIEMNNAYASNRNSKALQTFHRVDRLSRKLQRRLTQHTVAEVKALGQYSEDALRFVLATLELVGIMENRRSGWTLPVLNRISVYLKKKKFS
jgi:hypothetical protein